MATANISFSNTLNAEKYMLIEVSEEMLSEFKQHSLVFDFIFFWYCRVYVKAAANKPAVLCTDKSTYELKKATNMKNFK